MELFEDRFLRTAKLALDEPAARVQDSRGVRGQERYKTMPQRYAALVSSLLRDPPLADYAARVAKTAGDELLRRGRARWTHDPARTLLLFEQWTRNPAEIKQHVLARGIGPLGGRRHDPQSEELFESGRVETIGVYLGGPLHALQKAGLLVLVDELHHACEDALRNLARELGDGVQFRFIHPSYDDRTIDGDETWEWDLGRLEEESHALVVADLGSFAISFGVACEIGRFRQLPGALAHLRPQHDGACTSYFDGLCSELAMEEVACRGAEDVPERMVKWISNNLGQIFDAGRRRDDAVVLATPQHQRIAAALQAMSRETVAKVRDAADISPARLRRVQESAAAFAALPHHCAERLIELTERSTGRRTGPPDDVNLDNLLLAARDADWSAHEISRVVRESRKRVANLQVAATRPDQSIEFYEGIHDELFDR